MIRLAAITILTLFSAHVSGAQSALSEGRELIQKWVETRQLISQTKAEWASDKDTLLQTKQLFERELETVQRSIAGISTNFAQAEREQRSAEDQRKELQEALAKAAEIAGSLEAEARQIAPLLPEPLMLTVRPLIQKLPEDPAKTKAAPAERIQTVVALLNEIDKFNNAVTVANERRSDGAGEFNADVIYLGLATAYYVEPSGKMAGLGSPSAGGWKWTPKPEIAPAVKDLIAVYRNQKPAVFTAIPATIQ